MRINKKLLSDEAKSNIRKDGEKEYVTLYIDMYHWNQPLMIFAGILAFFIGAMILISYTSTSKFELNEYQKSCNYLAGSNKHYTARHTVPMDNSMRCIVIDKNGQQAGSYIL